MKSGGINILKIRFNSYDNCQIRKKLTGPIGHEIKAIY
jgi:hypothetical protein